MKSAFDTAIDVLVRKVVTTKIESDGDAPEPWEEEVHRVRELYYRGHLLEQEQYAENELPQPPYPDVFDEAVGKYRRAVIDTHGLPEAYLRLRELYDDAVSNNLSA